MKTTILILSLIGAVFGETTEVSRCLVSGGEVPINTYVEGCTTPPCIIRLGGHAMVQMVFKAPHTIRRMRTYAEAYLGPLEVNYDLGEDAETCNFLNNTYCPVLQDEVVQYTLRMYVSPFFPAISATIEFRIEDDTDTPFACIRVPITVVRGRASVDNLIGN